MTYQERLQELGSPSLEYRRLRADAIEVFKINRLDIVNIEEIYTFAQYAGTRGHSHKLLKRRSRLNVRVHVFSNRVWMYGTVSEHF